MNDKLDHILKDVGEINTTLAVQAEQLKEHIRRTELLEARVQPLEAVVVTLKGFLKVLTVLAVISTIVQGVAAIWLR